MNGSEFRQILHMDMNAFYCSCHAAAEPDKYQGVPTAVAGNPETRHGVVVTASYEARARGVRATMTVGQALRACPELILIRPSFDLYRACSKSAFAIVERFTPVIERFSIDECWADVTGSSQFGSGLDIAHAIQNALLEELGLPCSVGIGPNKFLAKMASDLRKPLGITEIQASDLPQKLWPQPVGSMFGIGGSTAERLHRLGIMTIGDLAAADVTRLIRVFGKRGTDLFRHANGIDELPVHSEREPLKSIGHSITLSRDVSAMDELTTVLLNLADQVGRRMRRHGLMGRTVQVTIRFADRRTITRSRTIEAATILTEDIYRVAAALLGENKPRGAKVRLLGISMSGLQDIHATETHETQLSLFEEDTERKGPDLEHQRARLEKLTKVSDDLRDKFGENILVRGRMLRSHESQQVRDHVTRGTSLQKDNLQD